MKNTKRRKVKPKPKVELQTLPKPERLEVWSRRAWLGIFVLVLLFSLGLKIYKADYSGVIYDESMTFFHFSQTLDDAVGKFTSTNNHVLNSVLVYFAYQWFGTYEHFVRVFSLSAGIIFSLSLAYVIYKTIQSAPLRVAALAWISFVPFVFDYSYYARGYAYMLAALMMQLALILFLLEHKIRFRFFWIPVLAFSLLNFISFGALISSVLVLGAMNLVFVFFYAPRIFRDPPSRWQPVLFSGVGIFLATFLFVFLLFHKIYDKILDNPVFQEISGGWFGWPTFVLTFRRVFLVQVLQAGLSWEKFVWGAALLSLVLITGVSIYCIAGAFRTQTDKAVWSRPRIGNLLLLAAAAAGLFLLFLGVFQEKNLSRGGYKVMAAFFLFVSAGALAWKSLFQIHYQKNLIPLVTGWTWVIVIFYGVVINKSIGLARNNVYFIPLVILTGAILLDRVLGRLPRPAWRHALTGVGCFAMVALLARNPVSPHYCYSRGASISRPLLRKLTALDPHRVWKIAITKDLSWTMQFLYYREFGYRFLLPRDVKEPAKVEWDLVIFPLQKAPENAVCFDRDYFDKANCAVVINNPKLLQDKKFHDRIRPK